MIYKTRRFSNQIPSGKVILPGNKRPCDPLPVKFVDLPEFSTINIRIWKVEYTKKVEKQISEFPDFTRKRIKSIKRNLEKGMFILMGEILKERKLTIYQNTVNRGNITG